jgi:two-component system, OmpR family, sensor kinase
MSLRIRLTLMYGIVTGIIVLLTGLLSYALHSRTQYDNVDRALIGSVDHVAGLHSDEPVSPELEQMLATPILPNVGIRLYDGAGQLLLASPNALQAPPLDPRTLLSTPSEPAYDGVVRLLPSIAGIDTHHGRFALMTDDEGHRWRFFVMPVDNGRQYFVADSSLREVDASVATLREVIPVFALSGLVITLLIGSIVAERALSPVAILTDTARTIARSRTLSQRVPVGTRRDELGQLALTFNEMLANLEQAAATQQRFVADASHELRTPLTAIQANLELLAHPHKMSPEERQQSTDETLQEVYRLSRLVADLLVLAHADSGTTLRHHPVDLDEVVLETLQTVQPLAIYHQVVLEPFEVVCVRGDRDRLKQLLLNLLDNALTYTPKGGTIRLGLEQKAGKVYLSVRDSGIGIPNSDLPHIFTRFYRADPARTRHPGGTGLGLSIVQWIVGQHQGNIEVESKVGVGTTITVTLPYNAQTSHATPVAIRATPSAVYENASLPPSLK